MTYTVFLFGDAGLLWHGLVLNVPTRREAIVRAMARLDTQELAITVAVATEGDKTDLRP